MSIKIIPCIKLWHTEVINLKIKNMLQVNLVSQKQQKSFKWAQRCATKDVHHSQVFFVSAGQRKTWNQSHVMWLYPQKMIPVSDTYFKVTDDKNSGTNLNILIQAKRTLRCWLFLTWRLHIRALKP